MTDTSVIYLDSTMTGHPQASGIAGAGIDVVSALVTGIPTKTLTSLTRSGTTATATLNAHGFALITTGLGPVLKIAGVNEAGWNGRWRATSIDTNTITFTVPDTLTTPATGTITIQYAGAEGWTKPFTGTNKAVFRSSVPNSAFLRVDNSVSREMRVRGYSDMTDIDSGTNPFPNDTQVNGGQYWPISNLDTGAERNWILISDDEIFYFFIAFSSTYPSIFESLCFGRPISWKEDDAFHDILIGPDTSSYNVYPGYTNNFYTINSSGSTPSQYMAKAVTQDGGSIRFFKVGLGPQTIIGGQGGWRHPPSSDGGIRAAPIYLIEQNTLDDRGVLPGIYQPPTNLIAQSIPHGGFYVPTTGPLSGKTCLLIKISSNSLVLVDLSGPWR